MLFKKNMPIHPNTLRMTLILMKALNTRIPIASKLPMGMVKTITATMVMHMRLAIHMQTTMVRTSPIWIETLEFSSVFTTA